MFRGYKHFVLPLLTHFRTKPDFFIVSPFTDNNFTHSKLTNPQKVRNSVMPAKAGIQNYLKILDSRLRGNDVKGRI